MTKILRLIGLTTVGCTSLLFAVGCSTTSIFSDPRDERSAQTTPLSIVATHHLGDDYSIDDVFVNGQWGGDASRGGGGGGYVCCVLLPSVWRPGLVARVKWRVRDWRHENKDETKVGIQRSIVDEGIYVATVPVERYSQLGSLYVHFFPGAKVRVVASMYGPFGRGHPITESPEEHRSAVVGTRVGKKKDIKPSEPSGE